MPSVSAKRRTCWCTNSCAAEPSRRRSTSSSNRNDSSSKDLLEGGTELLLTELKEAQLLKLVALDINAALKET